MDGTSSESTATRDDIRRLSRCRKLAALSLKLARIVGSGRLEIPSVNAVEIMLGPEALALARDEVASRGGDVAALDWRISELRKCAQKFDELATRDRALFQKLTNGTAFLGVTLFEHLRCLSKWLKEPLAAGGANGAGDDVSGEAMPGVNDTEKNIIETLGLGRMTGEELASKCRYKFNSNLKGTLASLRKRGILDNKSPGYVVAEAFRHLMTTQNKSQDKGQD